MALEIIARSVPSHSVAADIIVVGVFAAPGQKRRAKDAAFDALNEALDGALEKLADREEFTGKRDQTIGTGTAGRLKAHRVVVFGLGEQAKVSSADVRTMAAKAARSANGEKARTLVLALPAGIEHHMRAVGEGLELGAYRFTKYLTGDRQPKVSLAKVTLTLGKNLSAKEKAELELGQAIGEGINLTRDLGNEPSNVMTPAALADSAKALAKRHRLAATVFDFEEIKRRGMKLTVAVGQGSVNEPRFIHLTYSPRRKGAPRLVFVGKGVTFDSGGLSIKPAAGMGEMKADMSGAGNMIGLMRAVAALRPEVEVHAILTCVENMPDGRSYRPGDVWGSLDGKNVEIINTDAEGRLILADALAYARELKPDFLVDNATLTGACVVALGPTCSGYYASNDEAAETFGMAVRSSGETMWRMPLLDDLRDQIKSDIADVKQTGDRFGGSITAALFLREFIGETKNWVHVDLAGPAFADKALGWSGKGATGHGILTLLALVESFTKK